MAEYNGHPSWNTWNVSLWIGNDEFLYMEAMDIIKKKGVKSAVKEMFRMLEGKRTPDGARYNFRSVKYAIEGLVD